MAEFTVSRLEEIDEITGVSCPFRPVRQHFGISTFGVNAMTGHAAGDRIINEHAEAEPESGEELYVVVTGHARFELDGFEHDAPAGTFVHVRPGVTRTAFALQDDTTVLVVGGGPPGKPYDVNGWELFAPLMGLFEAGEYEEGADRVQELLEGDPPYSLVYYNAACFESRAGRPDDAITHLRRAVELGPWLAELARDDDDLDGIRERPEFAEIVGGSDTLHANGVDEDE